jgi:hypothetical protein
MAIMSTMVKGFVAAVVVALVLTAAPALAAPSSRDVAATRAFVGANNALARAAKAHLPATEKSIDAYIAQIGAQCPKAAAGSPENKEAEQLSDEVVTALTILVYRSGAQAISRLKRTVHGLHWSNGKAQRAVDRYVARLSALSTLALPDVCGDVKAWAANGYKVVPPATTLAVKRFNTIEAGPDRVSKQLLAPYEQPDERGTLAQTSRLERQLQETESNEGVEYWSKALAKLDLNP